MIVCLPTLVWAGCRQAGRYLGSDIPEVVVRLDQPIQIASVGRRIHQLFVDRRGDVVIDICAPSEELDPEFLIVAVVARGGARWTRRVSKPAWVFDRRSS